jgi:hypothetical protein
MKAVDAIAWALAVCGTAVALFFVFMLIIVARRVWRAEKRDKTNTPE